MFQKIICLFWGHTKCTRDTKTIDHYIHIPAGRGAFCRDPERYEYNGRLYHCARCGELLLIHGILSWEIEDLIKATLQDYPVGNWLRIFEHQDYNILRLYK